MAKKVVLHIGTPKSGTTYLQTLLWANKDRLAESGVLLPGRVRFDHNRYAQVVRNPKAPQKSKQAWRRMRRQVEGWPGTAVLSNEWFCMASPQRAARALEAFGAAEVHVVVTARDLVSTVPSAWQETLKLGRSQTLGDFIGSLDDSTSRWRWPTLDPALMLAAWKHELPPERLHVVTVAAGAADRHELMRRFARVCGFGTDELDLSVSTPNESISAEAARLLEVAGPRLRQAVDADTAVWTEPYRWIREYVGHQLLVPRRGSRIGLRADEVERLRQRSQLVVRQLADQGYDVVGDLADLTSAQVPPDAVHPDDVDEATVLDLSADVMADLLRRVRDETERARRHSARVRALEEQLGADVRAHEPRGSTQSGDGVPMRATLGRLRAALQARRTS